MAAIDIGPGAIDRDYTAYTANTCISTTNSANGTGVITSFELWFDTEGNGVKAGTFYGTPPNLTSRDVETIGIVTAGSKQTFSGLDCDVATGDFAGIYFAAGTLDMDSPSPGNPLYFKPGDQFGAGQQTYTETDYEPSIYGTGETITPPQTLSPSAIASAEAFGAVQLNLTLFPSGIASAEAFGALTVVPGAVSVLPTAIGSLEAFGSAKLNLKLILTAIASAEAFGTPIVISGLTIFPPAIPSAEAFGNLIIAGPLIVPGIASQEAFGSPTVSPGGVSVAPSGITSEELFGLPKLNLFVTPSGIVSGEAFGAARLLLYLLPTGIASAEAFGTPTVAMILVIRPSGIASVEAFGTIKIIVILAKGTDMKLPPGIPGQVSIPSGEVSLPS